MAKLRMNLQAARIGIIEKSSGLGGTAKFVTNLASELSLNEYNIIVFAKRKRGWYKKNDNKNSKLKYIYLKSIDFRLKNSSSLFCSYLIALFDLILKSFEFLIYVFYFISYSIKVIHLNNTIYDHIAAILAAKILFIPVVCQIHDMSNLTKTERLCSNLVDCFIVLSNAAKLHYSKVISSIKIIVISNGIILNLLEMNSKKLSSSKSKRLAVGVVGRVIRWKGQDTLIKAAPLVLEKIQNVIFYVVGDDPRGKSDFYKMLKILVKKLRIEESVVFTGWVDDSQRIFEKLDISVCTSVLPEPFGFVILESMIVGTPVIATKQGGPLDIIIEEENGLFYEPGNEKELASKIIRLLKNEALYSKISINAINTVKEKFDFRISVKEIIKVYESLLLK